MRKALIVAVCAAGLVGLSAGAASAGEITGSGKVTPIKERGVAQSECAYSGLNDFEAGEPVDGGRVQNYGWDLARTHTVPPRFFNPSMACNPNAEPPAQG